MSAEAILDAVAAKAGTVAGIKKAYGTGAGNAAVATLPESIADGPVCLVMYDGTQVIDASAFEHLEHRLRCEVYVAGADVGYAYKTLVPYVSRFVAAFRTDRGLGLVGTNGATVEAHVEGADPVEPVDVNTRPYSRLAIRVVVSEVTPGVTVSI